MDFLDLHPYPGYLPLPDLMDNFEVNEFSAKLWVLSELGGLLLFMVHWKAPRPASRTCRPRPDGTARRAGCIGTGPVPATMKSGREAKG